MIPKQLFAQAIQRLWRSAELARDEVKRLPASPRVRRRLVDGADAGRVSRMILGQGLRLVIGGIVVGGAVSMALARVLRAWMYEMSVYDAPTLIAVATLLFVVALVASWLPARRASRVDPVLALRTE